MQFVQEAFNVSLLGAWRMSKALFPLLRLSSGGGIVNVSSGAGSFGDLGFGLANHSGNIPVHGLTKLALNGLTVKFV